jgi:hypothetical protein
VSNKKTKVFEPRHIVVTLKSGTSKGTKSPGMMREGKKRVKKRRGEKERRRGEKLKIICIGAATVNLAELSATNLLTVSREVLKSHPARKRKEKEKEK